MPVRTDTLAVSVQALSQTTALHAAIHIAHTRHSIHGAQGECSVIPAAWKEAGVRVGRGGCDGSVGVEAGRQAGRRMGGRAAGREKTRKLLVSLSHETFGHGLKLHPIRVS